MKLVFNTCNAKKFQVVLQEFLYYTGDGGIAVVEGKGCLGMLGGKVLVDLRGEFLATDDQCSETFACHVCCLLVEPIVGGNNGGHDRVGTFLVEPDLATIIGG